METSNPTSPEPSRNLAKVFIAKTNAIIFLVLGLVGFLDATYLAIEHYRGVTPACKVITGCGDVLLSEYATVGPVPVAVLGMAYYLTVIVGAILYLDLKRAKILHLLSCFTSFGVLASLYFLYLQIFVIRSYCLYCLFSALISLLLFLNGWHAYKKTSDEKTA